MEIVKQTKSLNTDISRATWDKFHEFCKKKGFTKKGAVERSIVNFMKKEEAEKAD